MPYDTSMTTTEQAIRHLSTDLIRIVEPLTNSVADLADGIRGLLDRIDADEKQRVERDAKDHRENRDRAGIELRTALIGAGVTAGSADLILEVLKKNAYQTYSYGYAYWMGPADE